MTHTPGPWRIGDAGHSIFPPKEVFAEHPRAIATNISAANARLIAAAPELLAALALLEELAGEAVDMLNKELGLDIPSDITTPLECARDRAREIIAEAEGRES